MSKPRIRIAFEYVRANPGESFYYWAVTMPNGKRKSFGSIRHFPLDVILPEVLRKWRKETR